VNRVAPVASPANAVKAFMQMVDQRHRPGLLTQAPAPVSERQLRELSIRLRKPQAES